MDLNKYRRYYATPQRLAKLLNAGRCPVCEILLTSVYHAPCVYLDDLEKELIPIVEITLIIDKQ
jgi:hypothetical protein